MRGICKDQHCTGGRGHSLKYERNGRIYAILHLFGCVSSTFAQGCRYISGKVCNFGVKKKRKIVEITYQKYIRIDKVQMEVEDKNNFWPPAVTSYDDVIKMRKIAENRGKTLLVI